MNIKLIITGVVGSILALILLFNCGITVVDAGHRGVRVTAGKVEQASLGEGVQFYTPLVSKIVEMDVRTKLQTLDLTIYTRDIQVAKVTMQLNYNLKPDTTYSVYQTLGMDYADTLITPAITGVSKNVFGKWDAVDLIENRNKANQEVIDALSVYLDKRGISVTGLQIANISYSADFENSIEEKVKAEQQALTAKNQTVMVEERARQQIISAEATAKSMQIRAEALSKNQSLVWYEAVQKWNGELPQIFMGGKDVMPLMPLPQINK